MWLLDKKLLYLTISERQNSFNGLLTTDNEFLYVMLAKSSTKLSPMARQTSGGHQGSESSPETALLHGNVGPVLGPICPDVQCARPVGSEDGHAVQSIECFLRRVAEPVAAD